MVADLVIKNIKTIYTPNQTPPVKGKNMASIKVIKDGYIIIRDKRIIHIGEGNCDNFIGETTEVIDAQGKIALPGFIDSHSHLVHAGSREQEFALLRQGIPYLDILKSGGGILGTVEKTRAASYDDLFHQAKKSLDKMMQYGVVALEAKSGYGLCLDDEIKQLKVAHTLNQEHPMTIISTYMGAHAIPKEYKNNVDAYIEEVIKDLHTIKELGYAQHVDVFCEDGVFSVEQTKKILEQAKQLGFGVKLHADEIKPLGGARVGVMLEATSADHLIAISDEDIALLGKSNTMANLLPGTSFYLGKPYAQARKMIDHNVAISISGDYNPGSCPTENFQLIMQLAANYLKLTPEEILNAVTINPAYLMGLQNKKGSLEIGKDADVLLLDAPNLAYIFYHFGINHVTDVFIEGKRVVRDGNIQK